MNEAPLYSQNNILQRHDALHVLKHYAKLVKWKYDVEERVLDVGCGDGNVTADILLPFLPENVEKIVGIDISNEMVEFANKYHSNEKVKFIQGDISAKELIDEVDEEFDHIFSFFCLHWIQNQRMDSDQSANAQDRKSNGKKREIPIQVIADKYYSIQ
ncbi:methyltransferase [Holotrichia oblita]|uniref:Methyltransferase n=2 Tax=Holotrichia oblita TaxID=644536 RepID=A0ACB9T886_HOLOL|nr:methyltransferase [Holotrichia oblita]KAI4463019.1 methyltransferase [Holotrichia oblita]